MSTAGSGCGQSPIPTCCSNHSRFKQSRNRRSTMKQVAEMAAQFMAASARTAPKAGGKDFLEIIVITKDEALRNRDASNIENSQALLLIGLSKPVTAGYDCGACGYPTCAEFTKNKQMKAKEMGYTGPHCVMRMMDIGVALSSAAKTASIHNVDNRVQQRVGAAARALGMIQAEVVMGIPISIGGKSIYFDRQAPAKH